MKPRTGLLQDHFLDIYLISERGERKEALKFLSKMCCIDKSQSANSTAAFCLMPTSVSKVVFCKVSSLFTKIELGLRITHICYLLHRLFGFFIYYLTNQLIIYVVLENLNKLLQGDKENFVAPD